ncbi:MAG: zincin-like metallopeptidase domain-containing protein [bacterium]|nr:zincin-like metallopeptidase domain-containing protein [bacterium]
MLPDDPRYLSVTSEFLQGLGGEVAEWKPPWAMCLDDEYSHGGWPHRGNGSAFRGDNLAPLQEAAREDRHEHPTWITMAEVLARGGVVKKGARGVVVRVAVGDGGVAIDAGTEEAGSIDARRFRDHVVYNVSQISDLPASYYREAWQLMPRNRENCVARVDGFFRDLGVRVVHGVDPRAGARAQLEIGTDRIHMPPWELFNSARDYYVTLAHETVHWARDAEGHLDDSIVEDNVRLEREDLIAEVGAAFLCADLPFSNAPLGEQVWYVAESQEVLGDPRLGSVSL